MSGELMNTDTETKTDQINQRSEGETMRDFPAEEGSPEDFVEELDGSLKDISEDDNYELVELEIDEEAIVRYLEDDEGNRQGFVLMDEGKETEYFYVDEEESLAEEGELAFGITKGDVSQVTSSMNDIYRDGAAVAGELKAAFDDIKQAFDFSSFKK